MRLVQRFAGAAFKKYCFPDNTAYNVLKPMVAHSEAPVSLETLA